MRALCLLPLALALALPSAAAQGGEAPRAAFAPDRVVVRFRDVPASARAADVLGAAAAAWGVEALRPAFGTPPAAARARHAARGLDRTYVLTLRDGTSVPDAVAALGAHPAVAWAEPDYAGEAAGRRGDPATDVGATDVGAVARGGRVAALGGPDDAFFSRQWSLDNTGANISSMPLTAGADVSAVEAWAVTTGDPSMIVAVLDSGVRTSHPELAGRLWTNPGETPGNGVDDDGNGFIDDVDGWDFVGNDNGVADDNGHGSNVAGIVAATGANGTGYAGLNWQSRVMVLKIFNADLQGFYSWWAAAMVYAADHGARVLNLSGGGSTASTLLDDAAAYVHDAGVVATISMMNFNNDTPYYPAAIASTLAVGSTDGDDERTAPFCWGGGSNWGPHIDLSAPGNFVYGLAHTSDTDYGVYWCGTSMAAPHVAGAASLLLAQQPALTPDAVAAALRASADDGVGRPTEDTPGFDVYHGAGRLNVARLLGAAVAADAPAAAAAAALEVDPNPSAGAARAVLTLSAPADVQVTVVDALGRRVAVLHRGPLAAGTHAFRLAADLPAGVYAVRASGTGVGEVAQRVTVIR